MTTYHRIQDVPPLRYQVIKADPPWLYKNWTKAGEKKAPQAHYDCMSLDEIKALPVSQIAAPVAVLWLWVTNPMLRQGLDVLDAWGFRFVTAGHWVKLTKHGKLGFGTGYCLRSAGEPFLIGAIGRPKYAKNVRSVIMGKAREHSRKPEEAFEAAEMLVPDAEHRIELFGREARPGWDVMGDEVGKFVGAA